MKINDFKIQKKAFGVSNHFCLNNHFLFMKEQIVVFYMCSPNCKNASNKK